MKLFIIILILFIITIVNSININVELNLKNYRNVMYLLLLRNNNIYSNSIIIEYYNISNK
jgi:hypothetical protein